MNRLLAALTPWGRARLNTYVQWKGLSRPAVVSATLFLKRAFNLVTSVVAPLLFAPIFGVIAVMVKRDGCPVFSGRPSLD